MTLLEKAKLAPAKKHRAITEGTEKLELAVAWALQEITLLQAGQALDIKVSSATSVLYKLLLKAVRAGLLVRS